MLEAGDQELCLVGGVDSWIDIDLLDWLDQQGRLKSPMAPQGLIPGEAAAFLLLGTQRMAQRLGEAGLARVVAVGEAVDPTPWYLGGAVRGDGLATLLQQLLTPERPIAGATWADLNGEAWRADEWMTAYLRSADRHADPLTLHHPAISWGDIGAASGAALTRIGRTRAETGPLRADHRPGVGRVRHPTVPQRMLPFRPFRATKQETPYP